MPLALAGGIAIGIAESLITYNFNDQRGLLDLVLFVVVLVTLLVSGRRRGLAEADAGRWSFAPRTRPIPAVLQAKWWVRSLPAVRRRVPRARRALPARGPATCRREREAWSRVLLYALIALSLTVLTGWAGQLSLGQFAFVGVGGMTTAALVRGGVGFIPALFLAACVTAAVAILVGAPALRRPGLYLAVTTFAFAVMTSSWLLWRDVFLAGKTEAQLARQMIPLPAALFDEGWSLTRAGQLLHVCLIALGVVLVGVALLQRSRLGRSMIAVRDNERAAASFGISPTVGEGHRVRHRRLDRRAGRRPVRRAAHPRRPGRLPRRPSRCAVISIVVIGGLSSVTGAILGAFFVVGLPKLFSDSVADRSAHQRRRHADPPALLPGRARAGALQRPRRRVRVPRRAACPSPRPRRSSGSRCPRTLSIARREIPAELDAVIRVERPQRHVRPRASWSTTSTCTCDPARSSGSSAPTVPASRR